LIGHSTIHLITLVTIGETLMELIIITQDGTVGECMDMVGITMDMDTIIGTMALGTIMDTMQFGIVVEKIL
tara:strand:- start:219 stop:431 length:213 start_codon:yes stop_codon:yes gene_type:complete